MKIVLLSAIDPDAIAELERDHDVGTALEAHHDEIPGVVADAEVVIFRSGVAVSADVIDAAPELKLLIRAGSGLDNVDVEHARARGVRIVRVPGPSAQAVAELTFALMLNLARNVVLADSSIRKGHWPKYELGGPLTAGKTLGIIGVGNIGTRVGEIAARWGMDVIGCVEIYADELAQEKAAKGITLLRDCDEVLRRGHFVTIHVPLNESTRHLIGRAAFDRMKDGAYLINTSRGGVVDEEALFVALSEGKLAGAALDVHRIEGEGVVPPLCILPNVVLTPHIGAMAIDSQFQIGRRIVAILKAFEQGRLEAATKNGELVV